MEALKENIPVSEISGAFNHDAVPAEKWSLQSFDLGQCLGKGRFGLV